MTAVRLASFRFGDNNELLAEFILNVLAFTTRVPRQEDVGHDLVCALAYKEDKLLKAGPLFTVQVKSKRDPIVFDKEYEIKWLDEQENPHFICVTHREDLRIDLYSTWNRRNSFSWKRAKKVILVPGEENEIPTLPEPRDSREEQRIPLGQPVLTISAQDIVVEDNVEQYREILREWIELDRRLIVDQQMGLHWVPEPFAYETNKLIPSQAWSHIVYYNPNRNSQYIDGLRRFALNLKGTIQREIDAREKASLGDSQPSKALKEELQFLEGILQFEYINLLPRE